MHDFGPHVAGSAYISLTELGHKVSIAVVDSAAAMERAVARRRPELIVCPMLKKQIPRVDQGEGHRFV
jgi:hypothetical protein